MADLTPKDLLAPALLPVDAKQYGSDGDYLFRRISLTPRSKPPEDSPCLVSKVPGLASRSLFDEATTLVTRIQTQLTENEYQVRQLQHRLQVQELRNAYENSQLHHRLHAQELQNAQLQQTVAQQELYLNWSARFMAACDMLDGVANLVGWYLRRSVARSFKDKNGQGLLRVFPNGWNSVTYKNVMWTLIFTFVRGSRSHKMLFDVNRHKNDRDKRQDSLLEQTCTLATFWELRGFTGVHVSGSELVPAVSIDYRCVSEDVLKELLTYVADAENNVSRLVGLPRITFHHLMGMYLTVLKEIRNEDAHSLSLYPSLYKSNVDNSPVPSQLVLDHAASYRPMVKRLSETDIQHRFQIVDDLLRNLDKIPHNFFRVFNSEVRQVGAFTKMKLEEIR